MTPHEFWTWLCFSHPPLCLAGGDCQAAECNLRPSYPIPLSRGKTKKKPVSVTSGRGGRERERVNTGGGKRVEDCETKLTVTVWTHTYMLPHTHAHIPDYPGLILPAQGRQIRSELIKCLPQTYAGASGCVLVCVRRERVREKIPFSFVCMFIYLYTCIKYIVSVCACLCLCAYECVWGGNGRKKWVWIPKLSPPD